jgi:hypothetical protein
MDSTVSACLGKEEASARRRVGTRPPTVITVLIAASRWLLFQREFNLIEIPLVVVVTLSTPENR